MAKLNQKGLQALNNHHRPLRSDRDGFRGLAASAPPPGVRQGRRAGRAEGLGDHATERRGVEGAAPFLTTARERNSRTWISPIPTYLAAGHRWVDEGDIDAYIARCKAAGPQFGRATGKRRPGRPKRKAAAGA
jgi:hypothetical protein